MKPAASQSTLADLMQSPNPLPAPTYACAWVVLVMPGGPEQTDYSKGALVVAGSLRRARTAHAIVAMVTPDLAPSTRRGLEIAFDKVVEVPRLCHPSRPGLTEKQRKLYDGWVDSSYTKWNALGLTDYARVLLVDADVVFLRNCDELFGLRPPAACFSMPWDVPDPYRGAGARLPHGEIVAAGTICRALASESRSFVGCSWMTLLEPSADHLSGLWRRVQSVKVFSEGCNCVNGPDEVALAAYYAERGVDFSHIHPRYAAMPGKPDWVKADIRSLHYHGANKPWDQNPDAKSAWPDLKYWWDAAEWLAGSMPDLAAALARPAVRALAPSAPSALPAPPEPSRLAADSENLRSLAEDMAARRITRDIIDILAAKTRVGPMQEVKNALERWLVTLADLASKEPTEGPFHYAALRVSGEMCNSKFVSEMVEKKALSAPQASETLATILSVMCRERGHTRKEPVVSVSDRYLTCDGEKLAPIPQGGRMERLVEMAGASAAARVALRYSALAPGGCQWGLPRDHVDYLWALGVRNEGFASPLNSNLLGRAGSSFCSVFSDVDRPFGSIGDFFTADLFRGGDWVINPPFIVTIMTRAATAVVQALNDSRGRKVAIYFVLPYWPDCEAYQLLDSSPWKVASLVLRPGEYFYEDPSGIPIRTKASSTYFVLRSVPPPADSDPQAAPRHLKSLSARV